MVYLKLLLTALFWGGTFIAGRVVAAQMGPFSASFLRFAAATALFLPVVWHREGRLPAVTRRQFATLALLGATGVFAYNAFFFQGLKLIGAGRAALIVANNPVAIALLAALVLGERLGPRRFAGIGVSVAGALVVISRGDLGSVLAQGVGRGELFILGCVASWSAYSLLGRGAMRSLSPLVAVAYSSALGAGGLLPFALAEGMIAGLGRHPPEVWLAIAYLAAFGTVLGFLWYYEGIRALGPGRAAQFINFVPVSAVALAWALLGEPLTPSLLAGAALVITGVGITNAPGRGWDAAARGPEPPSP